MPTRLSPRLSARLGAIPIHIKIGEVETLRTEGWEIIPDDRQTRVETIGGVVVQDFGHVQEGDAYSCKITVESAGANAIAEAWHQRVFVPIIDTHGVAIGDMRVVIKKYGYVDRFEEYVWAQIELWRC